MPEQHRKIARQLIDAGKSKNEIIDNLIQIGLDNKEAENVYHQVITPIPNRAFESEIPYQMVAIFFGIVIIIGTIAIFVAMVTIIQPRRSIAALFWAFLIGGIGLGIGSIRYGLTKN